MKEKMIMLCLALGCWGAYAQHNHATQPARQAVRPTTAFENTKMESAYAHYLHLKDALVASTRDEAKKAAEALQAALLLIHNGNKAAAEAGKITTSATLDDQRKVFSTLSNEMLVLVKREKLTTGAIYIAYCPMANDNAGAVWLSGERQIKNPYFGSAMLTCGTVKETLQ